jgi:sterol 3beta-glucosyltransferase
MVLPIRDIETARKEKAYHWSSYGLVVVIRGHEELFFEFGKEKTRDECLDLLTQGIEALEKEVIDKNLPRDESEGLSSDQIWFQTTQKVEIENECLEGIKEDLSDLNDKTEEETPAVMFDSNTVSMVSFKPSESMRFTCLTIGSRGDVQPYIALCKVYFF